MITEELQQKIYQTIVQATVKVWVNGKFCGIGFFITPEGYVLTAHHCLGTNASQIEIETHFGSKFTADIAKSLQDNDIAVLKVACQPSHCLPLGLISPTHIEDEPVLISYPTDQNTMSVCTGKILRLSGLDNLDNSECAEIRKQGQNGGIVYHYTTQRVVALISASYKQEGKIFTGLVTQFDGLFKQWTALEAINARVAKNWENRLTQWQGKQYSTLFASPQRTASKTRPSKQPISTVKYFTLILLTGVLLFAFYTLLIKDSKKQPTAVEASMQITTVTNTFLKPGTVFRDSLKEGGDGPEMVVIPSGKFRMGDLTGKGDNDEQPVHEVFLNTFAMGKYEVTISEFKQFIQATGYRTQAEQTNGCYVWMGKTWQNKKEFNWRNTGFTQEDNFPVTCVSWYDAVAYTEWLSQQTGKSYRLPTESEWEYAARAGTETEYWWGNEIEKNLANCDGCGSQWGNKRTAPVGSFQPNPFGLYDVAGNVWEWTCSIYEDKYTGQEQQCAAKNEVGRQVLRGGSWFNYPDWLRSATRFRNNATDSYDYRGFRLFRSP